MNKTRNIGISAHIDAGKTTLTERVLFYTGRIHAIHEVRGKDGVGATMDHMDQERARGITIQSAATYGEWKNSKINIIDTPGHCDFQVEVERSLRVLDGAVLVLCGVAGVQSQSYSVDRQMKRYGVPCIAFVNKCDRVAADPLRVCEALRNKLAHNAAMIQHPIGLEDQHEGVVDLITRKAYYFEGESGNKVVEKDCPKDLCEMVESQRQKMLEHLAEADDEIAELFLEDEEITNDLICAAMRRATIARAFTPVCCGSAYKNKGVQPLLDNIIRFLPSPEDMSYVALDQVNDEAEVPLYSDADKPLVLLAFKLEDGRYGQLTYCRIYQGSVKKGDVIYNRRNNKKHKVGRLVRMHADQMQDIEEAKAGDIVALFGIDCASGDTFTAESVNYTMTSMYVPDAVITLAVEPQKNEHLEKLSKALNRFGKEDPTFRVGVDRESGQTIIGGMGELQLEVYVERIRSEYGVDVHVGQPQVAFRETITRKTDFNYKHSKQTGGKGQYAHVAGFIEPLDEGHYEFVDAIKGGVIPREYIPAVDKAFCEAMDEGGLHGFPVIGIRFTLNDGSFHAVDSSELAFKLAAREAFREAFSKAGPIVLEPVMKVAVDVPEEFLGAVLGGLNKRRGVILSQEVADGIAAITSEVPLDEMFGYIGELRGSTQGKGDFTMEFSRYLKAPKKDK